MPPFTDRWAPSNTGQAAPTLSGERGGRGDHSAPWGDHTRAGAGLRAIRVRVRRGVLILGLALWGCDPGRVDIRYVLENVGSTR